MIFDRRDFLKATAALPFLRSPQVTGVGNRIETIGVQLFTVRSELQKDFEGTLAKVAASGYEEVEFAGYFGRSPTDIRTVLRNHGLVGASAHFSYSSLGDQWPAIVEAARVIGHQYLVVASIDQQSLSQPDVWERTSELFNRAGTICKAAGIRFAYHNHLFEFATARTARRPYEILLESTDPALVSMQMDLCWITAAGQDPGTYFQRYPGRFSSVHVKDLKKLPLPASPVGSVADRSSVLPDLTEVGSGIIDWKRILGECRRAGINHYFVEHDSSQASLDSIDKSFRYLNALRF